MKRDLLKYCRPSLRGFSLLELMVVVVLLGLMIGLVSISVQSVGSFDLKSEITNMAVLSNEVYDLAASSGKKHRIVFDLDNRSYWVEEEIGELGEIPPDLDYEELMKSRFKDANQKGAEENLDFLSKYKEVENHLSGKHELPESIVFHGAWTEQLTEIARSGQVVLSFFPGGYTQASFVSVAIREEQDSVMYFSLSPLTASFTIDYGEPAIEDLLSVEGPV